MVTVVPAAIVGALRTAFYARGEFGMDMALQIGAGLVALALATAVMSAVIMGLSALTSRTSYVVLSFLGVMLIPVLLTIIMRLAYDQSEASYLYSIPGNIYLVCQVLLDHESMTIPIFSPFAVLLAVMALGFGVLARRILSLEGVA